MSTAIHRRVDALRSGTEPTLIARLASGWAVLGDPQVLAGYCLLLPDPVVPHLNALPAIHRDVFLADMARLGDAVLAVTGAVRINYALLGNLEPALHAHVFPRHANEPAGFATAHPWTYDWSRAPSFAPAEHDGLREAIRDQLMQGDAPAVQRRRSGAALGRLDHVDLTVGDLERSTDFYARLLPLLGYARQPDCPEGPLFRGDDFELGLQAARAGTRGTVHDRYTPGLHHVAFAAPSRQAVDRLHQALQVSGTPILDAPAEYPQYEPGYYAVFFMDPDGIKLEYVYRPQLPPA